MLTLLAFATASSMVPTNRESALGQIVVLALDDFPETADGFP